MKKYVSLKENLPFAISKTDHRRMIDTSHSIDRFLDQQRFGDRSGKDEFKDKIEWVLNNAIDKIIKEYQDKSHTYGIHSKSTGIGISIDWRKDYRNDNGKNHAIIISVLPIKKHHYFKPEDVVLIVEAQLDMLGRQLLREEGNPVRKEKNKALITVVNESYFITYWQGRLYEHYVEKFIEVE